MNKYNNSIKSHREGTLNQALFCALTNESNEDVYPLTMGWSLVFIDKNEFGDEWVGNKGVKVFKGDRENEYLLKDYIHDTIGYLLYGGNTIVSEMVEDVMHDVYGYKKSVPVFNF